MITHDTLTKKVAIGLSGGVDSALSAALLVEAGYEVTGVFLECWRAPGCRVDEDRKDAMDVAMSLKIPFRVLDFKKEYKDRVVEYFYREYEAGRTPNPDTMCNKEIKFGMFYDWALENGFDAIATGHYARVSRDGKHLLRGIDVNKDQSYFLYLLSQEQLEHIVFPIGHLTKTQVREEAQKRKLKVFAKPDSVGICFIGDVNVRKFLEERITPKKGEVVNSAGEVVGTHDGVWFYTIGQRHGFIINGKYKSKSGQWKHVIPPLYVIDKNIEKNQIVVGFGLETLTKGFIMKDIHWIGEKLKDQNDASNLCVRIRHRGALVKVVFIECDGVVEIQFDEPQKGVASGQAAVFYNKDVCIGGGIIERLTVLD